MSIHFAQTRAQLKAAVLALGIFLSNGLFADDFGVIDTTLNGDMLNESISRYITNISSLIPDSTTLQNVWSRPPVRQKWLFGVGLNGSGTMTQLKGVNKIVDSVGGFGGRNLDLTEFPEKLPYLPAGAIDIRAGGRGIDVGLAGMFMNSQWLPILKKVLGEDADFTYATFGIDVRYAIIDEKGSFYEKEHNYLPALTIQAGYYFTYMKSAFTSTESEKLDIGFRTDSFAFGLQISKKFGKDVFAFSPYFGWKVILSATDTDFSWTTGRPVRVNGGEYPDGATYHSGNMPGELRSYYQIYWGFGITLLGLQHLLTTGCAYNVVTGHFGINAGLRFIISG
jgi:hypothetical protein